MNHQGQFSTFAAEQAFTEGTAGWAKFGCGADNFGVRGQAKRDPTLARSARSAGTVKAPSPLRFAGKTELQVGTCPCGQALQRSRGSPILGTPLYSFLGFPAGRGQRQRLPRTPPISCCRVRSFRRGSRALLERRMLRIVTPARLS